VEHFPIAVHVTNLAQEVHEKGRTGPGSRKDKEAALRNGLSLRSRQHCPHAFAELGVQTLVGKPIPVNPAEPVRRTDRRDPMHRVTRENSLNARTGRSVDFLFIVVARHVSETVQHSLQSVDHLAQLREFPRK
jgi:hypothetical protein